MDYQALVERTYELVVELIERDDWGTIYKSSKDHNVYRKKSEQFPGYVYKCVYTVEMSLEDFLLLTLPKCMGGYLEDVDSMVKEVKCLENVSEDIKILRGVSNPVAMGLISSRELIDIIYKKKFTENDKKVAVIATAVEYDIPVKPKLVRAKRYPGGVIVDVIEERDKQILEVKQIEQIDFSGKVPSSLVDSFIPSELCSQGPTLKKSLKNLKKLRKK